MRSTKGAKGERGERGIPGPTGPKGVAGERGLTGERGPRGQRGITGLSGKVKDFTDVGKRLVVINGTIDHLYEEMATHITRMTQLQQQLDLLRENVRELAAQTTRLSTRNSH